MDSLTQVHHTVLFETETRSRHLHAQREQDRVARWTAALSASRGARRSGTGIRQVAIRLGDLVAELRCQLESRFTSEPAATPC